MIDRRRTLMSMIGGDIVLPEGVNAINTGSFTPTSSVQSYTITHGLGMQCQGILIWCDNIGNKDNQKTYQPVLFICAKKFPYGAPNSNPMQIAGRYISSAGNLLAISKEDSQSYMNTTTVQFRSVTGYFAPKVKDSSGNEVDAVYKWVAWG